MTTARLTFLIVSVWLVVVIGLIWAIMGVAHSADMGDCKTYANRASAEVLRRLLGFAFVDTAFGRFVFRKSYTFCVNADELPTMTFTAEEQPIVDGQITPHLRPEPPPGSVPATGEVSGDPPPEATKPNKHKKVSAPAGSGGPAQAICVKQGKRTVYANKHWRCLK